MPKKIFLHIGRNKTGTSALQYALANGRTELERYGFIYPSQLVDHAFLVYALSESLRSALPAAEQDIMLGLTGQLREEIQKIDDNVIISSEGLMNIDPAVVKDWLGGYEIRVVVYLREQVENLASSYQQDVKQLSQASDFESYVQVYNKFLSYNNFLKKWETIFGKENMIVRVYDKDTLVNKNIITDFLSILKIEDPAPFLAKVQRDANPSIKGALLEVKRMINGIGVDPSSLFQATYQALLDLAISNENYRGLIGADPDFVADIRSLVREDNRKIAQQYFEREELFLLRDLPVESKPSLDEIMQAFQQLIGLVRQRHPAIADEIEARFAESAPLQQI